jgi:hypothetical protein
MERSTRNCSSETMAPAMGLFETLSITLPLIELLFAAISPASSVGFSRNCPLPCGKIEEHPLKSI